jgi:exodeoxyribonuclease-3
LCREHLQVTQRGLPGQQALGARLISADIGDLSFTSLYCPNGKDLEHDDYQRKLAWYDALIDHLEQTSQAGRVAILGGDFNICPAPLDSWNEQKFRGEIFHTDEERARLQRLRDLGFSDAFRKLHPDTQAFSWWDYRGGAFHRKQGLRIDFLLASAAALARVRSVEIDRDFRKKHDGLTASDHAPVIANLD